MKIFFLVNIFIISLSFSFGNDWPLKYGHLLKDDKHDANFKSNLEKESFTAEQLVEFIVYLKLIKPEENLFELSKHLRTVYLKKNITNDETNKIILAFCESYCERVPNLAWDLIIFHAKPTNAFDKYILAILKTYDEKEKVSAYNDLVEAQLSEATIGLFFVNIHKAKYSIEEIEKAYYHIPKFYNDKFVSILNNDLLLHFSANEIKMETFPFILSAFITNNPLFILENDSLLEKKYEKAKILSYLNKVKDQNVITKFFEQFSIKLSEANFDLIKRFYLEYKFKDSDDSKYLQLTNGYKEATKLFLEKTPKLSVKEKYDAFDKLETELFEKSRLIFKDIRVKYIEVVKIKNKSEQKKKIDELIIQMDDFIGKAQGDLMVKEITKFKEELLKLKDQ